MHNQIDYTHFSKEELFDVLEQIDDVQYSANATSAYLVLQDKFSITQQDLDERYQDDGLVLSCIKLLLIPFGGEQSNAKQEMQAKLQRISNSATAVT